MMGDGASSPGISPRSRVGSARGREERGRVARAEMREVVTAFGALRGLSSAHFPHMKDSCVMTKVAVGCLNFGGFARQSAADGSVEVIGATSFRLEEAKELTAARTKRRTMAGLCSGVSGSTRVVTRWSDGHAAAANSAIGIDVTRPTHAPQAHELRALLSEQQRPIFPVPKALSPPSPCPSPFPAQLVLRSDALSGSRHTSLRRRCPVRCQSSTSRADRLGSGRRRADRCRWLRS